MFASSVGHGLSSAAQVLDVARPDVTPPPIRTPRASVSLQNPLISPGQGRLASSRRSGSISHRFNPAIPSDPTADIRHGFERQVELFGRSLVREVRNFVEDSELPGMTADADEQLRRGRRQVMRVFVQRWSDMACKSAEFSGSDHLHPGNAEGVTHALTGEYRKLLACALGNPNYQRPPLLGERDENIAMELADEHRLLRAHTLSGFQLDEVDLPTRTQELERVLLQSLLANVAPEEGVPPSPSGEPDEPLESPRSPRGGGHDGSSNRLPQAHTLGGFRLGEVDMPERAQELERELLRSPIANVVHEEGVPPGLGGEPDEPLESPRSPRGVRHGGSSTSRVPDEGRVETPLPLRTAPSTVPVPRNFGDMLRLDRVPEGAEESEEGHALQSEGMRRRASGGGDGAGIDSVGHGTGVLSFRTRPPLNLDRLSDGWPFSTSGASRQASEEIHEYLGDRTNPREADPNALQEQERLNETMRRYMESQRPPPAVVSPMGRACVRVLAGELKPKSAAQAHGLHVSDLKKTLDTARTLASERLSQMECSEADRRIARSLMKAHGRSYEQVAASHHTDAAHVGRLAEWLKQNVLEDTAREVISSLPVNAGVRAEPRRNVVSRMFGYVARGFSARRGTTA